jgi:hypothetical protein
MPSPAMGAARRKSPLPSVAPPDAANTRPAPDKPATLDLERSDVMHAVSGFLRAEDFQVTARASTIPPPV